MGGRSGRVMGDPMSRREAIAVAAASAGVILGVGTARATEEEAMAKPGRKFDAIVVGGGPAGLSAALVLGRACRSVLVCDSGHGRNAPAEGVHGFLGQDGTPPAELRRIGREQLKPYDVAFRAGTATDARAVKDGFEVTIDGAEMVGCRKLILATGLVDVLPDIPGVGEFWGKGVATCPYCHGWEVRGRPWAFFAADDAVIEYGTMLLNWTEELALLTNGPSPMAGERRDWLASRRIEVIEDRIEQLEGAGGHLEAVRFAGGRRLERAALFAQTRPRQTSDLPERLGCRLVTEGPTKGMVQTDPFGATGVNGLYVAGDASAGIPSVASAVAEGSAAAGAASKALISEDDRSRARSPL